jgi:CRP-like cAMP-binding protein
MNFFPGSVSRQCAEQNPTGKSAEGITPAVPTRNKDDCQPNSFLANLGRGRRAVAFLKEKTIYAQGDTADAVFYIQKGKVRLTIVSSTGKEAGIGIWSEGQFFGEGALAEQRLRIGSAIAMTDCELLRIDKKTMIEGLREEPDFADVFLAYLLARNTRYEDDLVDHLFNSSEKRLARILLLFARIGEQYQPKVLIQSISQETLAEMVGTTRSRVNFFMNKFRKSGFIDYGASGMHVHSSLLNIVLHD